MKEFINSFGINNFIIIISVVIVILIVLVGLFIFEKVKRKKEEELSLEEDDFDDEIISKPQVEDNDDNYLEKPIKEVKINEDNNVVYKEESISKEEAKTALEKATKKLVTDDNGLVGPTHFETEQEEKSIISYDELKKINYNIDEVNDNLLLDQGNEPITLEELYKASQEEQDKKPVDNPVFEHSPSEEKRFKNSEVISPVFGIYKEKKVEKDIDKLEDTVDLKDLEVEIRKTEEFLNELKKLKDRLN